ncbi:MAG: ketopantoate reductase C-terminal domain-containing protein, partial [Mariprofundaceae bacterium]|nr:ketopantoate reductase C-terminal domain-containing protein [Mariprofundaceae bacterium]
TLAMGPVKTSMWQDIERGRPSEVDFINGFVVQRGEAMGLSTPVNRMLASLVHAVEGGADSKP